MKTERVQKAATLNKLTCNSLETDTDSVCNFFRMYANSPSVSFNLDRTVRTSWIRADLLAEAKGVWTVIGLWALSV